MWGINCNNGGTSIPHLFGITSRMRVLVLYRRVLL